MDNAINVYTCDKNLTELKDKDSFVNTIKQIEKTFYSYEYFIQDLEKFYNDQLEDGDIEKFKGDIFELSEPSIGVQFPFCIKDNKLKFVETEAWRSIILSALSLNTMTNMIDKPKRKNEDSNERQQSISAQL